ncbi:MAG TPA: ACT domain-containing protein [Rubrobacteraceae bacterium]|nr:ACT domain-containing protein [Rubrobacteraceae bacterium]
MGDPVESAPDVPLRLSVLAGRLAICRLDADSQLPAWATAAPLFSVTGTADELSVVCAEERVPVGTVCERGWRAMKVEGPLEFGLTGVLFSVAAPLAESEVGILAIATYETDYVLVQEAQLDLAARALRERGHEII